MTCCCSHMKKHRQAFRRLARDKIRQLESRREIVIGDNSHHPARLLQEDRLDRLHHWLAQLQPSAEVIPMKRGAA